MRTKWGALAAALSMAVACGGDDGSGPGLGYPSLSAAVVAAFCVRGNLTAGSSVNGSISNTDCVFPSDGSFFETYQLKVASTQSANISMTSSQFDTFLGLFQITSIANDTLSLTLVGQDDDSGTGTNSLISNVTLTAGNNYLVLANGFDSLAVGSYTLSIQ